MRVLVSDSAEELARLRVTLGKDLRAAKDFQELMQLLDRQDKESLGSVLISSDLEVSSALEISESLRVTYPTIGVILIRNKIDSSLTNKAMAAGVREVVLSSNPESIVIACKKSDEISKKQLAMISHGSRPANAGKTIAFHGPRDGLGATCLATNLASYLVKHRGLKVCLIDTNEYMGDAAVRLQVEVTKSWLDLAGINEIDEEAVASVTTKTRFGFDLLLSPREQTAHIHGEISILRSAIALLQQRYDYILMDTDSRLGFWNQELFNLSDQIVLVTTPELSVLKNLKLRIKELAALNLSNNKLALLLNKYDKSFGISAEDIPELLDFELFSILPWDTEVIRFSNEGEPLVIAKERAGFSREIAVLAEALIHRVEVSQSQEVSRSKRSRKSA